MESDQFKLMYKVVGPGDPLVGADAKSRGLVKPNWDPTTHAAFAPTPEGIGALATFTQWGSGRVLGGPARIGASASAPRPHADATSRPAVPPRPATLPRPPPARPVDGRLPIPPPPRVAAPGPARPRQLVGASAQEAPLLQMARRPALVRSPVADDDPSGPSSSNPTVPSSSEAEEPLRSRRSKAKGKGKGRAPPTQAVPLARKTPGRQAKEAAAAKRGAPSTLTGSDAAAAKRVRPVADAPSGPSSGLPLRAPAGPEFTTPRSSAIAERLESLDSVALAPRQAERFEAKLQALRAHAVQTETLFAELRRGVRQVKEACARVEDGLKTGLAAFPSV